MEQKSKNTIILSLVALTIVLIGVTYGYFSARITGLESASTISLSAGRMSIAYSEGDEDVTASNIFPRAEEWITKTFSLKGYNTTDQKMFYEIGLNVITNGFNNYLTYDLTLLSGNNGVPVASVTGKTISGTGRVSFGKGYFVAANGAVHSYELKIYFKDNGSLQNDAQGAAFNAKIYVSDTEATPDGWLDAGPNTLIAGVKRNEPVPVVPETSPGSQSSSSGIFQTPAKSDIGNSADVKYANSVEDLINNTNTTSGKYGDVKNNLAGKFIEITNTEVSFSSYDLFGSGQYYYVTSDEDDLSIDYMYVYGPLTSNLEESISATEDDYGTSYYYRGLPEDNYVYFANLCWRIVRITGNGAIKITLYNYPDGNNLCPMDSWNESSRFSSQFNFRGDYNTDSGFMFSANPTSNDYLTANANDYESAALVNLKAWYTDNIGDTYDDYLEDVIWCNDKRIVTDTTFNPDSLSNVQGTGIGSQTTYFQGAKRLHDGTPSLKCGDSINDNKISKFTYSDTVYGNGAMSLYSEGNNPFNLESNPLVWYEEDVDYKIGLLTADEMLFAGASTTSNANYSGNYTNNYLEPYFDEGSVCTLTPYYTGSIISVGLGIVNSTNVYLAPHYLNPNATACFIRPTVALKANTTISGGTGTRVDPFIVN